MYFADIPTPTTQPRTTTTTPASTSEEGKCIRCTNRNL